MQLLIFWFRDNCNYCNNCYMCMGDCINEIKIKNANSPTWTRSITTDQLVVYGFNRCSFSNTNSILQAGGLSCFVTIVRHTKSSPNRVYFVFFCIVVVIDDSPNRHWCQDGGWERALHCDAGSCLTAAFVALHIPPSWTTTTVLRQKSMQSYYKCYQATVIRYFTGLHDHVILVATDQ